MGAPKTIRPPDRGETGVCGYCLGVTLLQSFFGCGATLGGTARAAGHTRGAFVLQMLEMQTAARHRLMQCKKGLETASLIITVVQLK